MTLQDLRKEIDQIDYQIHDLLNERAKLALETAKIKLKEDSIEPNFHRPEREREILKAISDYNRGPLSNEAVLNIFKTIIDECRQLQIDTHHG